MSVLEEAIVSAVTNDAAIAAVIGTRMRPELPVEPDEYPCLVYEKDDDEPRIVASGKISLTHAVFGFEAWANTYNAAKDLRTKLKTLLNPYKATVLGVPIRLAKVMEQGDLLEAAIGRERSRKYGAGLTLDVWYRE